MRLKPVFLSSLVIFASQALFSSPNIQYWSDFGVVPIQLDGKSQTIVRPFTLCRDPDANFPLFAEVVLGFHGEEWEVMPSSYESYSPELCQTFHLRLTPQVIGKAEVVVHLARCHQGVASCEKSFTVVADVVSESEYRQQIEQSVMNVGRQTLLYNDNAVTNIAGTSSGNKLWIGSAYQARIFDIAPGSFDLSLDQTNNLVTGLEQSLLCSDVNDTFIDFAQPVSRVRRRDLSGNIVAQSQNIELNNCGSLQAPQLRLVPGTCPESAGTYAGRVEVRLSSESNSPWGTSCDFRYEDKDARVICRHLGLEGGTALGNDECGEGSDLILLNDWHCNGDESSIWDCSIIEKGYFAQQQCNFFQESKIGASCEAPSDSNLPLVSSPVSPSGCPRIPASGLNRFVFVTCREHQAKVIELSDLVGDFSELTADPIELIGLSGLNFTVTSWSAIDNNYLMVSNPDNLALLEEDKNGGLSVGPFGPSDLGQILLHAVTRKNIYTISEKNGANVLARMEIDDGIPAIDNQIILEDVVTLNRPLGIATASGAVFIVDKAHRGDAMDIRVMLEVEETGFSLPGLQDVSTTTSPSESLSMVVSATSVTGSSSGSTAVAMPTLSPTGTPDAPGQDSGSSLLLPSSVVTLLLMVIPAVFTSL